MKKKFLLFLLFALVFASLLCVSAFAVSGDCGAGVRYDLDTSAGLLVISGEGNMANYPSFSTPWYSSRKSIVSVVVQEGVKSIGEYAFSGCTNLMSVQIASSVGSIGKFAFYNCSSLREIVLPGALKSMGSFVFSGCSALDKISFDGTTSQWNAVSKGTGWNQNAGSATLDGKYTLDCLKDSTILYFGSCGTDSNWTLDANGLLMISGSGLMYDYCSSMPGWYDVRDQVKSVVIANGVSSVGQSAFIECSSLRSVSLPNSITYIGDAAFWGCSSIVEIEIPANVSSFGKYAFYGCALLSDISVDSDNTFFSDIDGVLFDKNAKKLICYPAGANRNAYSVPESVTAIASSAFSNCVKLSSITLPATVAEIGEGAFSGCSSLKKIYIPASCTVINAQTFYGCTSLESVTFTNTLFAVFEGAFENCNSLGTIYFMGEGSEWDNVMLADGWDRGLSGYVVEFIYGINYGDANGDGAIDNKDLVRIKKYIASYDWDTGTSDVEVGAGADATGDGEIDNKDLVRLKKYIAAFDWDTGTSSVILGPGA